MDAREIRIEIQAWADRFQARIDRELTTAWPDLELRLRDLVDGMKLRELLFGPGKDFQDRLQPIINAWTNSNVSPILEDAEKELISIGQSIHLLHGEPRDAPGQWEGTLHLIDAVGPGAALTGVAIGVTAVFLAITKVTTWIVFTTLVVNWYLVVAGIAAGLILVFFGGKGTLDLKARLRDRFQKALLPKIREAILGESIDVNGKTQLSVRRTLRDIIQRGKADALRELDGGAAKNEYATVRR